MLVAWSRSVPARLNAAVQARRNCTACTSTVTDNTRYRFSSLAKRRAGLVAKVVDEQVDQATAAAAGVRARKARTALVVRHAHHVLERHHAVRRRA